MLHRRAPGTGPSIQRPFCAVNGQFRVEWMHFLLGLVRSCFLRFVSRQLQPNVRGDRASTRRDTLHGRSRGRKMQAGGKGSQPYSGRLKSRKRQQLVPRRKSLKIRGKVAIKWRGESGVLASDLVRGKNSKTFQFLSFPFIGRSGC